MLYGIFIDWQAEVPRRWQDVWQPAVVVLRSCRVAGESTEPAQPQRQHASLGVNLTRLRLVINMLVLLLVGACVSVAGPGGVDRSAGAHLARFWAGFDQRNVLPVSMLLGLR